MNPVRASNSLDRTFSSLPSTIFGQAAGGFEFLGSPFVNASFLRHHIGGDFFPPYVGGLAAATCRARSLTKALNCSLRATKSVSAVHFDEYADFSAGMDVRVDQALVGFPSGLFLRCRQPLLSKVVDRFIDAVSVFRLRLSGNPECRLRFFTQLFHQLAQTCHGFPVNRIEQCHRARCDP